MIALYRGLPCRLQGPSIVKYYFFDPPLWAVIKGSNIAKYYGDSENHPFLDQKWSVWPESRSEVLEFFKKMRWIYHVVI